jgi:hypothetical protein
MSGLKKSAWIDFAMSIPVIIGLIAYALPVRTIHDAFIFFFLLLGVLWAVGLLAIWRGKNLNVLDEREIKIYWQAQIRAADALLAFQAVSFFLFLALEKNGAIPVYSLLVIGFGSLFFRQLVQSTVILSQCWKEK